MIIDSPIISGSYSASGSLNQFGSVTITGSLFVNGVTVTGNTGSAESASYAGAYTLTSSFQNYTSSTDARIASINASTSSLNSYTSSTDAKIASINAFSASILNYTSSTDAKLTALYTFSSSLLSYTSSNNANISSLNSYTSSATARFVGLETATASLNSFTSSANTRLGTLEAATASLNNYTSSATNRFVGLEAATSSLNSYTSSNTANIVSLNSYTSSNTANITSLNSYTSSATARFVGLEAATSSLNTFTSSINSRVTVVESKYATTGSNTFIGTQTITGSLLQSGSFTSTGTITAQTLVVQTITSSVIYSSGSNVFGNNIANTQIMTGSLLVTGSTHSIYGNVGIGTTSPYQAKLDVVGSGGVGNLANIAASNSNLDQLLIGSAERGASSYFGLASGSTFIIGVGNGVSTAMGIGTYGASNLTFGTNNTTKLTIDSTGNVGIGTSIPGYTLDLKGTYGQSTTSTQPFLMYGDSAGTNGLFRIQIDEVNDSFGTGARTYLGDGGIDVFLGTGNSSYTPSNTYIALNHSGEISMGAGSGTKHLLITTGGNVGIGTTIPNAKFDVSSATKGTTVNDSNIAISSNESVAANIGGTLGFWATSSYGLVILSKVGGYRENATNSDVSSYLNFETRAGTGAVSEKMRITSGGNVGIGTTLPNFKLQVDHATTSQYVASFRNTADNLQIKIGTTTGALLNIQGSTISADTAYNIALQANGGNVGIGTTNPGAKLDVSTVTAGYAAILTNTNGASDSNGLLIKAGTVSTEYNVRFANTGDTTTFFTIKGNGNVGIGTISPGYKLDVNGEVAFSPNTAGKNTFILTTNASNDGRLLIKSDTTNKVDIQANGATYFTGGSIGIGTTNPANKLDVIVASSNSGVSTSGIAISDGAANRTLMFLGVNTAGYTYIQSNQDNVSSKPLVLQGSGGNVGIGTTNPTNVLDVTGNVRMTSTLIPQSAISYNGGLLSNLTGASASWIKLGTLTIGQGGYNAYITIMGGAGYNAANSQNGYTKIFFRSSNGSSADNGFLFSAFAEQFGYQAWLTDIRITQSGDTYTIYAYAATYIGSSYYKVEGGSITWTALNETATAPTTYYPVASIFKIISNTTIDGTLSGTSATFTGNVGIGTTSPNSRLTIQNSGASDNIISEYRATNGSNTATFRTSDSGYVFGIHSQNSGDVYIKDTSDNVWFYGKNGGNVGIGTTNPTQKLEVVGGEIKAGRVDSSNEGGQVSFGRASDNATGYYIDVYGSTSTPDLRFVDVTNSAVRMTLTSGGTLKMATTTISNNNAVFGATDNGGYKYFSGDLANGEKFGSQGGTYVQGFYFISWYSTSGRGYAIFATVSPAANAGTVLVSSGGWAAASATYNASSAISLAFDGSSRGPVLSNNTGTTVSFYSYVFGGS